jgi:hypothetical protein
VTLIIDPDAWVTGRKRPRKAVKIEGMPAKPRSYFCHVVYTSTVV